MNRGALQAAHLALPREVVVLHSMDWMLPGPQHLQCSLNVEELSSASREHHGPSKNDFTDPSYFLSRLLYSLFGTFFLEVSTNFSFYIAWLNTYLCLVPKVANE